MIQPSLPVLVGGGFFFSRSHITSHQGHISVMPVGIHTVHLDNTPKNHLGGELFCLLPEQVTLFWCDDSIEAIFNLLAISQNSDRVTVSRTDHLNRARRRPGRSNGRRRTYIKQRTRLSVSGTRSPPFTLFFDSQGFYEGTLQSVQFF